jgi:hypothetical protein
MAGFMFRLETTEGVPANPSTLESIVANWEAGDSIYLGRRTIRVVGIRDDDGDQPPVLIVEEASPITGVSAEQPGGQPTTPRGASPRPASVAGTSRPR